MTMVWFVTILKMNDKTILQQNFINNLHILVNDDINLLVICLNKKKVIYILDSRDGRF